MTRRAIKITVITILIVALAIAAIYIIKIKSSTDGDNTAPSYSVCFLMGNTKNVKQVDSFIIKDELDYGFNKNGDYSVIVIDGNPNEISDKGQLEYPFRLFDKKANDQNVYETKLDIISKTEPKESEIDILKAIYQASGNFNSNAEEKRIVIYSSGISTTGDLNFANNPNLLLTNTDEIVKILDMKHAIPNLNGVTVIWYGFNHTDGNQPELNSFEEYKLKTIWTKILEKSGAIAGGETGYFNEASASEQDSDNEIDKNHYPNVKIVDFSDVINIPEEEFGFRPGTAELLDENQTKNTLKPIAEDIKNMGCPEFYIIGSTASADTKENCMTLSIDRAKVIRGYLVEMGVPESCLKAYGIGREYIDNNQKWRVYDLNKDGSLNKEKAQMNRKVMFIPADSKTGEDFIKDYNNYFK